MIVRMKVLYVRRSITKLLKRKGGNDLLKKRENSNVKIEGI